MRRLLFAAAMLFAASPLALAQTAQGTPSQSAAGQQGGDAEQEIMRLLEEWNLATEASVIERAVADDFTGVTPYGDTYTKARSIAGLKSGERKIESSVIDEFRVRVYGDTAVATYRTTDRGQASGRDRSGQFRWTDTWVRRGGRWQVVASHGSRISGQQPTEKRPQ